MCARESFSACWPERLNHAEMSPFGLFHSAPLWSAGQWHEGRVILLTDQTQGSFENAIGCLEHLHINR
jgi:hypothetical protein